MSRRGQRGRVTRARARRRDNPHRLGLRAALPARGFDRARRPGYGVGVIVRSVEPGDRAEWRRMRGALWPEAGAAEHAAETEAFFRGEEPLAAAFVSARPSGGLAGFLEFSVRSHAEGCGAGPVPYVEGWHVDPDARGRGAGRALIAAAERWARERGYMELASDARLDNEASHRAHLALGFDEVERAVHFRKAL